MELEEFHQIMKARRNVYDLLRCLFLQEPSEEFFRNLAEEGLLETLSGYHPDMDEGLRFLSGVISDSQVVAFIPDLVAEFTRLFVGPQPVPLYESVYRSREGLLMQEETLAVRRKYFAAGLVVNPQQSFPEDHVGTELEFIFFLCQRAGQVQRVEDERAHFRLQQEFFREHLIQWIPALCDRLFIETPSPYFKGISRLTKGFVMWDYDEIVSRFPEE